MRLVNLTPHMINFFTQEGEPLPGLPSEGIARVTVMPGVSTLVDGVPVPIQTPATYGEIIGLPDPQDGVIYIVSMVVAQKAMRADVVSPDSGPTAVRVNGQVIGVRGLMSWV